MVHDLVVLGGIVADYPLRVTWNALCSVVAEHQTPSVFHIGGDCHYPNSTSTVLYTHYRISVIKGGMNIPKRS